MRTPGSRFLLTPALRVVEIPESQARAMLERGAKYVFADRRQAYAVKRRIERGGAK